MAEELFKELRERLDQYSMGYPATESGIEIKILKYLFSDEDAQLFMALSPMLEEPGSVAGRVGRPEAEVAEHMENMSRRGLLFRQAKGDKIRYGAIPFVHGLFEFQVKSLKPDLAEMVETYFHEAFYGNMQKSADYFLRTIPIGRSVDTTQHIASYDDAVEILRTKDNIVVTDCICRRHKQILDQGCEKPMEACFMFGSMAQYYLDRNIGRKIDLEEAIDIVSKCQDAGLVTQPATAQNPGGMCNCCGDCCGVLAALNLHPKPAEAVFSNHFAEIDADECTACETCMDRCQMNAITMNDDAAEVNKDRCIGCGLCVTTCPTDAITLRLKPEEERRVPPAGTRDQMILMAQKRGII